MKKLQIPLEEGKFYHIFNRGNNSDRMFYKPENYRFFLRRLDQYLSVFIEVYAYCLLPNHFHLLVRVKETGNVPLPGKALHPEGARLLDPTSAAFHRLFTSYSKAINKQEGRHGSLIENPFKRKEVSTAQYLSNLVFYIHANPQLHGICGDFRQYPWSSYQRILFNTPSKLQKQEVVNWFNDTENYISYHDNKIDLEGLKGMDLE